MYMLETPPKINIKVTKHLSASKKVILSSALQRRLTLKAQSHPTPHSHNHRRFIDTQNKVYQIDTTHFHVSKITTSNYLSLLQTSLTLPLNPIPLSQTNTLAKKNAPARGEAVTTQQWILTPVFKPKPYTSPNHTPRQT